MKIRITIMLLFLSIPLFFWGCSEDPNKAANKLYTEASLSFQKSKTQSNSYSELYDSYRSTKSQIERLISKYPSSNIAVGLLSGNTKISGLTLSQFRKLESSLRPLVELEESGFKCALLAAKTAVKTIKDSDRKATLLS